MSKFSDALLYLRKRDKLSQQDLADRLEVSRSLIGMYETGQRMPSYDVLEAIADIFNTNIDFLVGHVDSGKYSSVFRNKLSELIANSNSDDAKAVGIDYYNLGLIVDGAIPLTFDDACDIAEQFGETLDSMLGIEEPAVEDDGGAREIMEIMRGLSPDNRAKLLELGRLYLSGQRNSGGNK